MEKEPVNMHFAAALGNRRDSLAEYESARENSENEESEVEIMQVKELDDLNVTLNYIRAKERETEMATKETRSLVLLREAIKAVFSHMKVVEEERKRSGKIQTEEEITKEVMLKSKIVDINHHFNHFNTKRKKARIAREEREKMAERMHEKRRAEQMEKEIKTERERVMLTAHGQDKQVERNEKETQTEAHDKQESGKKEVIVNKRKERSPEERVNVKRIMKRLANTEATEDEETWVEVTKRKREANNERKRKVGKTAIEGKTCDTVTRPETSRPTMSQVVRGVKTPNREKLAKEGNAEMKANNWKLAIKKTEAVEIKVTAGKSFAETVKHFKTVVPRQELEGVKMVRKTRAGNVLIEFEPGTEKMEGIKQNIAQKMGDDYMVWKLQPRREFEIKNMDATVDREEFVGALCEELQGMKTEEVQVKTLRDAYNGTKLGVVVLEKKWAEKLAEKGLVKIGYTRCRVTEVPRVVRCFNCQGIGHFASQCKKPETRRCRRCGEEGHDGRLCQKEMKCFLCAETQGQGGEKGALGHVAGSYRCPAYQKERVKALEGPTSMARRNRNG